LKRLIADDSHEEHLTDAFWSAAAERDPRFARHTLG
jgi:hypothetical protein